MKISLGFSPCPNDTFIFDALVNKKIDTQGLEFEVVLADVEELNNMAFAGQLDITKLSYHAFSYLTHSYNLFSAGSALGNKCGPLLIGKREWLASTLSKAHIAIPGKYTTANFLLQFYLPNAVNKTEYLFSEIEPAVQEEKVDLGVIIHENRFTYAEKGLVKVKDLGEHWEATTHHPIPLGGIVGLKRLPMDVLQRFNQVLKNSIQWASDHYNNLSPYVTKHAQEMEESVMRQHIDLYVNDYTKELGKTGEAAIRTMFKTLDKGNDLLIID